MTTTTTTDFPTIDGDYQAFLLKELTAFGPTGDINTVEFARHLDSIPELKSLRDEFHVPLMKTLPNAEHLLVEGEEESIYMCGNSLGLMPKATKPIMDQQFKKWAEMGVFGHLEGEIPWALGDESLFDGIADIIGALPSEVGMMNGLTINLHCMLTAFWKPTATRNKILMESRAFPSDHYAVQSQIQLKGMNPEDIMICLEPREGEDTLRLEDILKVIEEQGESISLVLFSGIQYYTGQLFDIPTITKVGKAKGCVVGWDLAHAFANVPLKLHEWDVDFAVFCSYKYGSTGAGGLAGLFVHEKHATDKRIRMTGWWSHRMSTRFVMDNKLDLDDGANGYRISNPPFMLVVGVKGFLQTYEKTNMLKLRQRSIYLTGYFEKLINYYFDKDSEHRAVEKVMCQVITPPNPFERGCQLSLKFNIDIGSVYAELVKRGVAVDKRYPNVIRATPVHFYNNFEDVVRFVQVLIVSVKTVEKDLKFNC
uniref:Kynureninase n=1 Tax=Rhabditophanes sp. KR3021 TaxID=114890 RepID=A0AC35TY02_9BILA